MFGIMKKNMVLGVILDIVLTAGIVLLAEFIIAKVQGEPFVINWLWIGLVAALTTVVDIANTKKKEKQQ